MFVDLILGMTVDSSPYVQGSVVSEVEMDLDDVRGGEEELEEEELEEEGERRRKRRIIEEDEEDEGDKADDEGDRKSVV